MVDLVAYKVLDQPWSRSDSTAPEAMLTAQGQAGWQLVAVWQDHPRERTRWIFSSREIAATLTHLTTAGSYLIASRPGFLSEVSINTTGASGSLVLYDGIDATGAVMAVIDISKGNPSSGNSTPWPFKTGLFAVLSAAADITILT